MYKILTAPRTENWRRLSKVTLKCINLFQNKTLAVLPVLSTYLPLIYGHQRKNIICFDRLRLFWTNMNEYGTIKPLFVGKKQIYSRNKTLLIVPGVENTRITTLKIDLYFVLEKIESNTILWLVFRFDRYWHHGTEMWVVKYACA